MATKTIAGSMEKRCDCESATCHPHANCTNQGTVKTIYSTICAECAEKMPAEYLAPNVPINICNLANFLLGREAITGADFDEAGLQMLGGCQRCGASIACYNAYPSRMGYWLCGECIYDNGYETVEEAADALFPARKANAALAFFNSLSGKIEYSEQIKAFDALCRAHNTEGAVVMGLLTRAYGVAR